MSDGSLGRQSSIVFGGLAASIALGVVLQSYLASRLGTSPEADVFYLGTAVPTLIATATLGSSSNALIRYATESPRTLDPRVPKSAGRSLVMLSAAIVALLAGIGVMLETGVVRIGDSSTDLGVFLLIVSIVPALIAVTAIGTVLALADHDFVRAAWGGAANGVGILGATLLFGLGGLSAPKLAAAVVVGYLVQIAFVSSSFRRLSADIAGPLVADRDVARAATVGVLILIGASLIYKSQPLVERAVGASVGAGVPAALGYTDKITMALSQFAAFGFAMASLPSLSRDLAAADHEGASDRLRATFIGTAVSTVIVIAFALSSSGDIVRVLYERGSFSAGSADLTHSLMLCALPSVVCGALAGPLVSVAYANKRVRQVARVGIVGFVAGTSATIGLSVAIGAEGVVLGTGVGFATTLALFMHSVPESLPNWRWSEVLGRHWKELAVVAAVVGVTFGLVDLIPVPDSDFAALVVLGVRMALLAVAGFGSLIVVRRNRSGHDAPLGVSP